jgi:hypothetical protein
MLKMAAAARQSSVEGAYLVVAATIWESPRARQPGRRHFPPSPGPAKVVPLNELFDEYGSVWAHDLTASSARPTRFPEALEFRYIASAPVPAWSRHDLRAIAVRDAPRTTYRPNDQGWPAGLKPH